MKGLRKAALGLAVVACLLTLAPPAQAGPMDTPLVLVSSSGWISGWFARLAGWLGRGKTEGAPAPRPNHGTCIDPSGTPVPCKT